ncbi:agmatine deiminase family protein [Trichlorobacter ammonificans]|uniref:Agmatine deiminase n=1 Tax=Trichlorobacter ammonificans TaxID=2916410 RepID=A0ABM9D6W4_9BACT|nr:agmatine deiminase family protein [Trichlorobacter ammonificans]CAH2030959.1 Agmatine deiminase [Trichlorobacter ammonificans]
MQIRLPAEWEEQDGILLAWPHAATDWTELLEEVGQCYLALVRAICRFERVLVVTPDADAVGAILTDAGVEPSRFTVARFPTNDTWTRDFGPLTVLVNGTPVMLDFGFNGWGLKFAADRDNQVSRLLKQNDFLLPRLNTIGLVLEGGSVESDGRGTILTTSQCLLSPNRNPQLTRLDIEEALAGLLGARRVLWLEHGWLAGDDTDAHIDTLARLCPDDTIAYVSCPDPRDEHFAELKLMEQELVALRTAEGRPYRLLPLPWPAPRYDDDGQRLPATYANFLVVNGAVLVPTYDDPADSAALAMIALAFPGREIIGIDCRVLIRQHGSLHCVTMQLPKGTLP